MFCVSNIMVSFVCTSFLGINGYTGTLENTETVTNEISLTSSDLEPASQLGEEKGIVAPVVLEEKKEEEKKVTAEKIVAKPISTKKSSSSSSKKTATVAKKEVASTKKYTPAKYDSVTGNAIVEYAKKYLGLRYVSGGNSLSKGTDCSGFTKLIYKEFGITLSRAVKSQAGNGTYVSKNNLQKGDLVFYNNGRGGVSHVGIYMGNGKVIHESNPRDGVKISSVNMMHYVTARRVINSKAIKIANDKVNEEKKTNEIVADTSSKVTEAIEKKDDIVLEKGNTETSVKETTPKTEVVTKDDSVKEEVKETTEENVKKEVKETTNESVKEEIKKEAIIEVIKETVKNEEKEKVSDTKSE